jgi:spermidine synthase
VINADAADYVSKPGNRQDIILADACDRRGICAELGSTEFYRKARRRLTARGVFVANICGDKHSVASHLKNLREAFEDEVLSLRVQSDDNLIVFGFKRRRPDLDWTTIEAGAADLKRRFHLDFPRYARDLEE